MVCKQIGFRLEEIRYCQRGIPTFGVESIVGSEKSFEIRSSVFMCRPYNTIEIFRPIIIAPVEIDHKVFVVFVRLREYLQGRFGTAPSVTITTDSVVRLDLAVQVLFIQIKYPCDLIAGRTVKRVALLNFCCGNRGVLKFNDLFSTQDISTVSFSIMMDYDFSLILREAQLHSLVPLAHIVMPPILASLAFVGEMCFDNIALLQNYWSITERTVVLQAFFSVICSKTFAVGIDCDLHIYTSKLENKIFL